MKPTSLQGIVLGLVLVNPLALEQATPQTEDRNQTPGQRLFVQYQCWQCHGYEGQGGAAAPLVPVAYPLEAFSAFVRYTNLMPAYSPDVLPDGELGQIYEYLSSIPEPPSLEDIERLGAEL